MQDTELKQKRQPLQLPMQEIQKILGTGEFKRESDVDKQLLQSRKTTTSSPAPEDRSSGVMGDLARDVGIGFSTLASKLGAGYELIPGMEKVGQGMQDLFDSRAKEIEAQQTPEWQRSASKEVISENLNAPEVSFRQLFTDPAGFMRSVDARYDIGEGALDPRTLASTVVRSLPQMLPAMAGGAGVAKTLAARFGISSGLAGIIGAAIGEGGWGGLDAAKTAKDTVMNAPLEQLSHTPEFQEALAKTDANAPMEQRVMQARKSVAGSEALRSGLKVGAMTAVAGAPSGHFMGKVLGGEGGSVLARFAKGGALEALQEMPQSGYEQYAQNETRQKYVDPSQQLTQGIADAAAKGAMAGFATGGPMDVMLGAHAQPQDTNQDPKTAATHQTIQAIDEQLAQTDDINEKARLTVQRDSLERDMEQARAGQRIDVRSEEELEALDDQALDVAERDPLTILQQKRHNVQARLEEAEAQGGKGLAAHYRVRLRELDAEIAAQEKRQPATEQSRPSNDRRIEEIEQQILKAAIAGEDVGPLRETLLRLKAGDAQETETPRESETQEDPTPLQQAGAAIPEKRRKTLQQTAEKLGGYEAVSKRFPTDSTEHQYMRAWAAEKYGAKDVDHLKPVAQEQQQGYSWANLQQEQKGGREEISGDQQTGGLDEGDAATGDIALEGAQAGRPAAGAGTVAPEKRKGRETQVAIPNKGKVPARFELAELDEVAPSHIAASGFETNPMFTLENERRYHDEPASQAKVLEHGQNLDAHHLMDAPDANMGAPIVDAEGNVLGGNGRAMSIGIAYAKYPERATAYKDALLKNAQALELDPQAIRGMKNPVLVRRIPAGVSREDRQKLIADFNATFTYAKAAKADGKSRAGRFSQQTIDAIAIGLREAESLRQFFDQSESTDLVEMLIKDGVVQAEERNAYLGEDGLLNPDGKKIVEAALRGRIVEDYETLAAIPGPLMGKIDAVIPHVMTADSVDGWSISPEMKEAVKMLADFKRSGQKHAQDYLDQLPLGEPVTPRDAASPMALSIFNLATGMSKKDFVEAFAAYAKDAKVAAMPMSGQMGMAKMPEQAKKEAFNQERKNHAAGTGADQAARGAQDVGARQDPGAKDAGRAVEGRHAAGGQKAGADGTDRTLSLEPKGEHAHVVEGGDRKQVMRTLRKAGVTTAWVGADGKVRVDNAQADRARRALGLKENALEGRGQPQGALFSRREAVTSFIDKVASEKDPQGEIEFATVSQREVDAVLSQGGPDISGMSHFMKADGIKHALKTHGDQTKEASRNPAQRALTIEDLKRVPDVVAGYDDLQVKKKTNNKTSLVYSKSFDDGKIVYVERVIETSSRKKPRLVTKTAWVVASDGVESTPAPVSTPGRNKNITTKGEKSKSTSAAKKYFEPTETSLTVSLDTIIPRETADPERLRRAKNLMESAAFGLVKKRKPLLVVRRGDGTFKLLDGNTTLRALKDFGETEAEVEVVPPYQRGVQSMDELYAQAEVAQPELKKLGQKLAKKYGGALMMRNGLKSRKRADEKAQADYAGDVSRLTDINGATLIFETAEEAKAAFEDFRKDPRVMKDKDRYEKPMAGYRDFFLLVQLSNGHITEVQFNTAKMIAAKEGLGHTIYDVTRAIDDGIKASEINAEAVNDQLNSFFAISEKYYDLVFEYAISDFTKLSHSAREISEELNRILDTLPPEISNQSFGAIPSALNNLRSFLSNTNGTSSFSKYLKSDILPPPFNENIRLGKPAVKAGAGRDEQREAKDGQASLFSRRKKNHGTKLLTEEAKRQWASASASEREEMLKKGNARLARQKRRSLEETLGGSLSSEEEDALGLTPRQIRNALGKAFSELTKIAKDALAEAFRATRRFDYASVADQQEVMAALEELLRSKGAGHATTLTAIEEEFSKVVERDFPIFTFIGKSTMEKMLRSLAARRSPIVSVDFMANLENVFVNGDPEGTLFSRGSQAPPPSGVPASEVRAGLSQIKARNALPVEVVQRQDDLPRHILDANDEGGGGVIDGVYDPRTGKIYIVADNLTRPGQAAGAWLASAVRVWRHEQGHHGIRGFFRETFGGGWEREFLDFLETVHMQYAGTKEYQEIKRLYPEADKYLRAEELFMKHVLEKVAAKQQLSPKEQGMWRRLVKFVKRLLGHAAPGETYADSDIERVAMGIFGWLEGGKMAQAATQAVFSRTKAKTEHARSVAQLRHENFDQLSAKEQKLLLAEAQRQLDAVKEIRDGKGRLLAPNGKPSRLNEHQWKQVRTPWFKSMFGNWELGAKANESVEPVVLTGNEIAGPDTTLKELQEAAENELRRLQAETKNSPIKNKNTGLNFIVTGKTRKEIGHHSGTEEQNRLAAGIKGLIENGVLFSTKDNMKKDRIEYPLVHRFYAPVQLGGNGYLVEFTAKESRSGALYYDHVILKVTRQNRPLAEPGVRSPGVQESVFAVVDGIKIVGQLAERVKGLRPELDFSHTQVVDKNGEPLVVYHGTNADFTQFRDDRMVWVSSVPELADNYAAERTAMKGAGNPAAYPVFANVKSSFNANGAKTKTISQLMADAQEQADKVGIYKDKALDLQKQIKTFWKEIGLDDSEILTFDHWQQSGKQGVKLLENYLAALGFDAIRLTERGSETFGLFSPTQIKGAIGNVGAFSPTNPDIRYSRSPEEARLDAAHPSRNPHNASVIERFDKQKTVTVNGNEFATFTEPMDMPALRAAAIRFVRNENYKKEVVNQETGHNISITPSKIKNALAHGSGPEKIQAVAALPEMLERGVLVYEEKAKSGRFAKTYIYAVKLAIAKKKLVAGLVVHEDVNGRRFYNHELSKIENLEAVIVTAGRGHSHHGRQSPTLQGPSVMKIVQDRLGVKTDIRFRRSPRVNAISDADAASRFGHVEDRLREARKSPPTATFGQKAREFLSNTKKAFTRHFIHLDPKLDGAVINILREQQEVTTAAWEKAGYMAVDFIKDLSENERNVFTNNLVLADMLRDLDNGTLDAKEGLPFGYRSRDEVQRDLEHFQAMAGRVPRIKNALEKRRAFMTDLRQQLVEHRLLPKDVLESDANEYFHHQVLEYMLITQGPGLGR